MATRTQSQMITTSLWLLVAAAIGLFVYQDRKAKETAKQKEESSKLLFVLDPKLDPAKEKDRKALISNISELHVLNAKADKTQQQVRLKQTKHGDHSDWDVQAPVQTTADGKEAERLLADILQAKRVEVATQLPSDSKQVNQALQKYGLENPQHSVHFVYQQKKYGIQIGKKDGFTGKYFARIEDSKEVILVESSLFYSADKKLFDLRRKEVFTDRTPDIQQMSITRAQDQLVLKRIDEGNTVISAGPKHDDHGHHHGHSHGPAKKSLAGWQILQPVQAIADKQTINLMLNSLRYLKTEKFVSEDVQKDRKSYGLDKPDVSVELSLKNNKGKESTFVLHIAYPSKAPQKAYVARPDKGAIAEVDRNALKDLTQQIFYFREKRALFATNSRIKQIAFQQSNKTFRLLRIEGKEDEWRVLNPGPQNADKKKATAFLNDILSIKVSRFVAESATPAQLQTYGLDQPQMQIAFYGTSNKELLEQLWIGKQEKDGYYATNNKKEKIFLIKTGDISKLPTQDWQFIQGGKAPTPPAARTAQTPAPTSQPAPMQPLPKSLPKLTIPAPRPVAFPTTTQPAIQPKVGAPALRIAPASKPAQR